MRVNHGCCCCCCLVVVQIKFVLAQIVELLHGLEVNLVPQHAADATKPSNVLGTLLAFVCDDLQGGAKVLVVVGEPFQQRHLLLQLQLNTGFLVLKITK